MEPKSMKLSLLSSLCKIGVAGLAQCASAGESPVRVTLRGRRRPTGDTAVNVIGLRQTQWRAKSALPFLWLARIKGLEDCESSCLKGRVLQAADERGPPVVWSKKACL